MEMLIGGEGTSATDELLNNQISPKLTFELFWKICICEVLFDASAAKWPINMLVSLVYSCLV